MTQVVDADIIEPRNLAGCSLKKTLRLARKRELLDKVRVDWKDSTRRACEALQINRSLYVYKSKRGGQADLTHRIKQIAETGVRYGYRRIHVLLLREGRHVTSNVFTASMVS